MSQKLRVSLLFVLMLAISDFAVFYLLQKNRSSPAATEPPPKPGHTLTFLEASAQLLSRASAAGTQGDHDAACALYLQAATLHFVAGHEIPAPDATLFDAQTPLFLARNEWSLTHPQSSRSFDDLVSLLKIVPSSAQHAPPLSPPMPTSSPSGPGTLPLPLPPRAPQ